MKSNDQTIKEILSALSKTSHELSELAFQMRKDERVLKVLHTLEFSQGAIDRAIEGYVDAELKDGRDICLWIDIKWEEEWKISSWVLVNDSEGQNVVHKFDDEIITNIEFVDGAISHLSDIVTHFDAFKYL
jgi:hypothetical protein